MGEGRRNEGKYSEGGREKRRTRGEESGSEGEREVQV